MRASRLRPDALSLSLDTLTTSDHAHPASSVRRCRPAQLRLSSVSSCQPPAPGLPLPFSLPPYKSRYCFSSSQPSLVISYFLGIFLTSFPRHPSPTEPSPAFDFLPPRLFSVFSFSFLLLSTILLGCIDYQVYTYCLCRFLIFRCYFGLSLAHLALEDLSNGGHLLWIDFPSSVSHQIPIKPI